MANIKVVGNVGKDPELKFIDGAKGDFAVAKFSVADTPRKYNPTTEKWEDGETVWYSVSCTGTLAEAVTDIVKVGNKVQVEGDLKVFEYVKDDQKKLGLEIRAKSVGVVPTLNNKSSKKAETEEAWPF